MLEQQILGNRSQIPQALSGDYSYAHSAGARLLGNQKNQFAKNERERFQPIRDTERAERSPVVFKRQISSARLEELKKQKFTAEGKEERIAKALAALHQESSIVLPMEVLRYIAEDPDLEDQF